MLNPTITEHIMGPVGLLETLVYPSKRPQTKGWAIMCHPNPTQGGSNTNKVVQTTAKALSLMGYQVYCPNLRGVGNSAGVHDFGVGEIEDVLAVLQHIRQTQAPLPILLAGFSFGAYVAAHVQTRTEIDQLLLLGLAAGKYPIATPHVPTQTLVIHGEADEVIPLADVMDWARPQALPVMVFPETSHFFHGRLIQLGQAIQSRLPPLP